MSAESTTSVFSSKQFRASLSASGFALLAIVANLVNFVFYYVEGLYSSGWMELAGIGILLICVALNQKKYYTSSKILSLLIVNFQVVYLSAIQGISGGAYLYLFPYILSLLFFLRLNKKKRETLIPLAATILTLLAVVFLAPYQSELAPALQRQLNSHHYLNILISFILTIIFFVFAIGFLKSKERKVTAAKKFRDTIFNTSSDAIIIVDITRQVIVDCNNKAFEMFNFIEDASRKQAVVDWDFLKKTLYRDVPLLAAAQPAEDYWQGDLLIEKADGSQFYSLTNVVCFTYENTPYCKISFLDITLQKKASMEMMRARQAAEKALNVRTRFLSNMSHELRTPLNGIIGSTSLVEEQFPELGSDTYFKIIRTASQHMLTLVNQVLDYSKLESDQFQIVKKSFQLRKAVDELISSFKWDAETKDISISYNVAANVPDILLGDPLRLLQVLMNLVSNAVKFSSGGYIKLTVTADTVLSGMHFLQFELFDNGIGIAADKREAIFEGFVQADAETTRKYGGTGLGLTISRELVKRMGGTLSLRNNEPKGSVFFFSIPFALPGAGAEHAAGLQEEKILSLSGKKILVVEDNPINMLVAKKMLLKWGAEVHEAVDGKKGWQLFSEGSFDILLIDLEMPEMDGSELIRLVRNVNPKIPAIAFTAAAYDNIFDDLSRKGFSAFVPKPFIPYKLNNTIARLLSVQ
jgi:signal transduction histidine kinase/CheY-like chemotaxis protein